MVVNLRKVLNINAVLTRRQEREESEREKFVLVTEIKVREEWRCEKIKLPRKEGSKGEEESEEKKKLS